MTDDDPVIRKLAYMPASLWAAIDAARRQVKGPMPSEAEMVRILIREALVARDFLDISWIIPVTLSKKEDR